MGYVVCEWACENVGRLSLNFSGCVSRGVSMYVILARLCVLGYVRGCVGALVSSGV